MDKILKILLAEMDMHWQEKILNLFYKQNGFSVIGIATDKRDVLKFVREFEIDIVLINLNFGKKQFEGINTAYQIKELSNAKIIMLADEQIEEVIIDIFNAGVDYFLEFDDYLHLPFIISNITKSTSPYEILLKKYHEFQKEQHVQILTKTEKEIFFLAVQGYSRREIISKEHISINTVKKHIKQILTKLEAKNMKEAIHKVDTMGLSHKTAELEYLKDA